MLRRVLALLALSAILTSAGCVHHHFARRHRDCCAPCGCEAGPAFHSP